MGINVRASHSRYIFGNASLYLSGDRGGKILLHRQRIRALCSESLYHSGWTRSRVCSWTTQHTSVKHSGDLKGFGREGHYFRTGCVFSSHPGDIPDALCIICTQLVFLALL